MENGMRGTGCEVRKFEFGKRGGFKGTSLLDAMEIISIRGIT
jgi:hypothetical protein